MRKTATPGTPLKICYFGNFSANSVGEPEIADALEELGCEVVRAHCEHMGLKELRRSADGCDLVLYAKLRTALTPSDLGHFLDSLDVPKVCWMFDLYWGF